MAKYTMHTDAENCSGCLRCQMACSFHYTRRFNPAAARLQILMSDSDVSIAFSEDCNACGLCADNCFYGALGKHKAVPDE